MITNTETEPVLIFNDDLYAVHWTPAGLLARNHRENYQKLVRTNVSADCWQRYFAAKVETGEAREKAATIYGFPA